MRPEQSGEQQAIGVVGTGTMGRGIMQVAATAGFDVLAYDQQVGAANTAKSSVASALARLVEKGRMDPAAAAKAVQQIHVVDDLGAFSKCTLVIEAIIERLDAKQDLFAKLDSIVASGAMLATNTSSLPVTAIAAKCRSPERVAGLHFFNPVPLMRLVEVIPGIKTASWVPERLMAIAKRLGREPVLVKDSPGFLVNHVGRAYIPEALRILSEGIALPHDIDHIMRESAGFRMGPFELVDLVGLDVAQAVMESFHTQYYGEPMYAPSTLARMRMEGGLLGRKSGEGFYSYRDSKSVSSDVRSRGQTHSHRVWISPKERTGHKVVRELLSKAGVQIESSERPSPEALCIVTPLGYDATTAAVAEGLDPRRTIAVDTLFPLNSRRTLMVTPVTAGDYIDVAEAMFTRDGGKVSVVNDSPGFVAQRIVAMLVNVGCQIAQLGIAKPADIDFASKLGLNYPFGPLEFGDRIGASKVLTILEGLHAFYGEPRYRPTPWLRRRAALDVSLLTPNRELSVASAYS